MDLDDVIPSPQYQMSHSRVARAPLPAVWDLCTGLPWPLSAWAMRSRACASPARLSGKKLEPFAGRSFST